MSLRIFVFIATVSSARFAAAQPTTASASGDALFDQAQALMDAGKLAEACAAFEASEKAASTVTTMLSIGNCREQNNQLATAYGWYRQVERKTRGPVDEDFAKRHRFAKERAQALVDRLSKLTIEVAHRVPGLEVLRGTELVEVGAWGHPLPVDGGTFEITVRAPDHEPWKTTVVIATERDAKTVTVPTLVARPRPKPRVPSKVVPIAFAGGAVALLGGALGLDLVARGEYKDSQDEPDKVVQDAQWASAKTKRYAAQGLALAGVGCAGIAVWLYVSRRGAESPPARGVRVEPVVGGATTGLQLVGSF